MKDVNPEGVIVAVAKKGNYLLVPRTNPGLSREAREGGTIVPLDGGCLGLSTAPGEALLILWPFGTAFNADGDGVVLPDVGEYQIGDFIELAGGFESNQALSEVVPTSCSFDAFFVAGYGIAEE